MQLITRVIRNEKSKGVHLSNFNYPLQILFSYQRKANPTSHQETVIVERNVFISGQFLYT